MVRAELIGSAVQTQILDRIQREHRPAHYLLVDSSTQCMHFCCEGQHLQCYVISTAEKGLGAQNNSFKTPPGLHQIADKIGGGAAFAVMFKARIAQPICSSIETQPTSLGVDTITSRILRLDGLEAGINRGPNCDSYARLIYIHGTAEEGLLGQAVSHGCIRMRNTDVIELFAKVQTRALVYIY